MTAMSNNSPFFRTLGLWSLVGLVALVSGCSRTDSPGFRSNMVAMAEKQIPADQQQQIATVLEAMFGTPDEPFVLADSGLDINKIRTAAGPVKSDEFGHETGLYRRHCGHCHGTTGDGQGPTALILNPYPRDYRQGRFKFKSTQLAAKPTDHDLEAILRNGVPGTAMPTFDLLPEAQIKALVEYVKYLSTRGETEIRLINAMSELGEGEKLALNRATLVDENLKPVAESWTGSKEAIVKIEKDPDHQLADADSIAKGRELFYSTKANCVKCHGVSALGDGQTNDYDYWNKAVVDLTKSLADDRASLSGELTKEERAATEKRIAEVSAVLHGDTLPVRTIAPRNLRQGIYRGGRRPIDIYRRIYTGIYGTPMPGGGPATPGAQGTLSNTEIWNLVDYVLALPYEPLSQPPRQQRAAMNQTANY